MTRLASALAGLLALPLLACGSADHRGAPSPPPSSVALGTPSPVPREGSAATALPAVTNPVSLPALMRERFHGSPIRVLRETGSTDAYRRFEVTYKSGSLTISGVLLRPRGPGPYPGVVLAHGHIDPPIYVTGQGLRREQDWLASHGFAVLHTDYRGHAASDPTTELDTETRLGYARDVIAAVLALKRQSYVDPGRLALLGRSMGGGVVQDVLVAKPGLVQAAVLYSSVSSSFLDNLRRWTLPERPEVARRLFDRFGRPGAARGFYAGLSPRTYFDRITEPVLLFHGTSDDSCPVAWSHTTQRLMRHAGVDSRLTIYPGEEHAFGPRWEDSIRRTVAFLRSHL